MKRILFSPIGSTDPIAGQHDGALLHIIRVYQPEKVYLYLSKEICELEEKDHRYSYCLEKMQELLGIAFEVEYIRRPELVDVHIFDDFLVEFRKLLAEIQDEADEVLLNVSSGTPAMKSALQVLSAIFERQMIPVQVATPKKGINDREDVKGDYDVELQWELNLDNEENHANRCAVSSVFNMTLEMKKNLIKKHLQAYDYVAALRIAGPIASNIQREAIALMEAGAARLKLDKSTCAKRCGEAGYHMFPKQSTDQWAIFEYLMVLKLKLVKEEYADYLRAISPVFFILMERILRNSGEIDLDSYLYEKKSASSAMIKMWDGEKISKHAILSEIVKNTNGDSVVTTGHYARLIRRLDLDSKTKKLVDKLRQVETDIRNTAAHAVTYITDDVIKNCTGMNAETIFKQLKELTILSGINISDEDLRTYDKLNAEIDRYLENCGVTEDTGSHREIKKR